VYALRSPISVRFLAVPDQADTSPRQRKPERSGSPAPGGSGGAESKRRHRTIVWSLIVLASVLLVISITANWVQLETLDTDHVADTTDEIVKDEDVQEQLSIYAVDQLYANVDVQGQIEERLPSSAKALAAPVAAATRQLALNVAQRALESPQVQDRVSSAVRMAHEQFVSLIRNESEYLSTTGGEVTLNYGSVVADLAARLGVDPATISNLQRLVQEFSQDLRQRLTMAQTEIASLRAALSQVEAGELSPELKQDLQTLETTASELQSKIADLEQAIKSAEGKVPSQLHSRLADLEGRLSDLEGRLGALAGQIAAVLKDPQQANVEALDASLASIQARVTALLGRPVVQNPGQLLLMDSTQLDGVRTLIQALRNLGFVLPLLVLLLYLAAIYLAKGWRREALIAAGGGILAATLLLLLARRLIGGAVESSLASSETVEPAIKSVWEIVSDGLRERALFILVIGLAFVGAGVLAGPGRHAVAVRRFLAPYLRDQPVLIYSVVAVSFLLWLAFLPAMWWASRDCAGRRRGSFQARPTAPDRERPATPNRRRGTVLHSRRIPLAVPVWYPPIRPLRSDRPRTRTHRTIWTLTDTSTPTACRLGPKGREFKSRRPD
jgi:transcriptional regulator with XRE-family HTH domain